MKNKSFFLFSFQIYFAQGFKQKRSLDGWLFTLLFLNVTLFIKDDNYLSENWEKSRIDIKVRINTNVINCTRCNQTFV
jgi:hypothetical protein